MRGGKRESLGVRAVGEEVSWGGSGFLSTDRCSQIRSGHSGGNRPVRYFSWKEARCLSNAMVRSRLTCGSALADQRCPSFSSWIEAVAKEPRRPLGRLYHSKSFSDITR